MIFPFNISYESHRKVPYVNNNNKTDAVECDTNKTVLTMLKN